MLGDGARTRLFRQARRILEEDRLRYASERGYDVRLLRFGRGRQSPRRHPRRGEGARRARRLTRDPFDDEARRFRP